MGSTEKFCLKWNDFETNISVAFRELRDEKDFFDVTLACDDSQIQAHKVILSACSPFFRNVLRNNPHQHPLLYLKGVKYKELVCVLNFMYMGEVNVAQEELNSFLAVAEDLRVKGLTQGNSESGSKSKPDKIKSRSRSIETSDRDTAPPASKRPRPSNATPSSSSQSNSSRQSAPVSYQADDDDIQEVVPVKSEPRDPVAASSSTAMAPVEQDPGGYQVDTQQQGQDAIDEQYADDSYDYGDYNEGAYDDCGGMMDPNTGMAMAGAADGNKGVVDPLNVVLMETMAELDDMEEEALCKMTKDPVGKRWSCNDCEYTCPHKRRMIEHVESKHLEREGLKCSYCAYTTRGRNALRVHHYRQHKENKMPILSVKRS